MRIAGRLLEIWQYPVSSVGGGLIASANVGLVGVTGDRTFALIDEESGLPAAPEREFGWRKSLHLSSKWISGEYPTINFPDQGSYSLADPKLRKRLSDYFGFPTSVATFDPTESRDDIPLIAHRHQPRPLHLVTTSSLLRLAELRQIARIASQRFRPTVVIETDEKHTFVENEWIGKRLYLGSIQLVARERTRRCGITLLSQPDVIEDPELLRSIVRHNQRSFGIYCSIENAGTIQIGDELRIID